MDSQSVLEISVRLYRMSNQVSVLREDGIAHCNILANKEVVNCVNRIYEQRDDIISQVKINDARISLPLTDDVFGQTLAFVFNFPVIQYRRFFNNLEHLISHHTGIKKGNIPDYFYLIEEDYLNGESNEPEKYQQLKEVCRWIRFLKEALPHTEEKNDSYVFVLLTEDKENKGFKKHLIESRFEYNELRHLQGLDKFEAILASDDLHSSERLVVVRNALEELFSMQPAEKPKLGYTLSNFQVFKQLYQDNYETYINSFSLRDFKKEVIEKHNEFASLIESNLNDIVNKAFIIPVSIASIGALLKANDLTNGVVVTIGIFFISLFMWRLINQHLIRLKNIYEVLSETFDSFKDRQESAAQFVNKKHDHLVQRANSIRNDLKWLKILSIAPLLSAVVLLLIKHPKIVTSLKSLFSIVFCLKS